MNISAICIRNPIPVILLFIVAILLGLQSFFSMKVQDFPDIDLPVITVSATLAGANPQQLETEVAKKLENAVAPLQGMKNISTTIQDGSVSMVVEFELEKPLQEALDDVRSAVSSIRSQLPNDLNEPIVQKVNMANAPMVTYTINSKKMDEGQLSWYVDNDINKRLMDIEGVGSVTRVGGVDREIQILIDPNKLQGLDITVAEVSRQLKQIQVETSAGKMDIGNFEQPIRAIALIEKSKDLNEIELSSSMGRKIKLEDIATIKDDFSERRSSAWFNGEKVVGFEVKRTKTASDIVVLEKVQKSLAKLKVENPDLVIEESFNFVNKVKDDYKASMTLLYEGAFLAVLVVFVFLKDMRATIVSAIALPLSIIPAFWFMQQFDFTINGVTLLALSLVIGVLVDDAIVEVENIERHMREGASAIESAMKATEEIGLAVIATTATLIAVFLPTAFMPGVPGLVFRHFGWTAALSIFASLLVARMLTPILAAYFMRPKDFHQEEDPKWMKSYLGLVQWSLNNKLKTIVGAVAFFILSLAMIPLLPTGFIPPDNSSQTQVMLELEPGVTLSQVENTAKKAEELLKEVPEIVDVYTTIGAGSSGGRGREGSSVSEVRKATLTLKLVDIDKRDKKQEVEKKIRTIMSDLPGAKVKVGLGANGEKYVLSLVSEDAYALSLAAKEVEKDIRTINGIGSISSSASLNRTEVLIKVDYTKAADFGVTTNTIADTIRVATLGDFSNNLSKLNSSVRQLPIVVKLNEDFKENLDALKELRVPTKSGFVELGEMAEISFTNGPAVINRYNRERNINIEVETNGVPLGLVQKQVAELPSMKNLPAGVSSPLVGESERMKELFGGFGIAMLTGVISIYVILVLLFKDFIQPVTILMALPLSFGGAFVALLLTGKSFSLSSLIGIIMLMGIATKNSILMVDYAIMAMNEGKDKLTAIMDACHKRARPIIMTTIAMGAGMLPVALQIGNVDGSFRSPMAIAVIGGLITSTFLSLLVIPSVFLYMSNFKEWFKRKFKY